ncbi:hypothetical protein DERP_007686 [Dermatophagoides pteronyssinus]|uniref:Uncharacterized protein n=1 Tax=Dermatophagoides pteronyssinus TaxID=6956 RepID=A0ABQ8JKV9_DERPT|nr:hypothetical protein DERP_007686 [Dermatophagoides pteronyssinus]
MVIGYDQSSNETSVILGLQIVCAWTRGSAGTNKVYLIECNIMTVREQEFNVLNIIYRNVHP